MSYCTQSDIETRIGYDELTRLSDYDGDGLPDSDVVDRAISDAEGTIDSYLGERYKVPLQTVPDVVKNACADLAVYQLQQSRSSVTDDMKERRDDILSWLKDVAKGTASLGSATELEESSSAGGVRWESDEQRFGRDKPL